MQHERVHLGCGLAPGSDACCPDLLRMRVQGVGWVRFGRRIAHNMRHLLFSASFSVCVCVRAHADRRVGTTKQPRP
eukprot:13447242-Alexandrium_andersonii.AAC.1